MRGWGKKIYGQEVRGNTREEQNKITFDLTYYPVFQNVKKILASTITSFANQ